MKHALIALLLAVVAGCGGSPPPPPASAGSEPIVSPPPPEPSPAATPASARETLDAFTSAIQQRNRDAALALTSGGALRIVVDQLLEEHASGFKIDAPADDAKRGTCFPTMVQYPSGDRAMTFCVKQQDGKFEVESVTVQATAEPAATPSQPAPPPPPAAVEQSSEGKIVSRAKDRVTIQIDGAAPAAGSKAELYRKLEQAVMFIPAGAWIGIANVTVDKVEGNKVTLTINERKSTITINGAQVDHFKPQTAIRLSWTAAP